MKFPYGAIFRQAFGILKTNRFLWILGLLLVWGYLPQLIFLNRLSMEWTQEDSLLMWGLGLLVLMIIVVIYFRARAALILAIKGILDKQPADLEKSWKIGRNFYGRMIQVTIILQTPVLALSVLMALPVSFLWMHQMISQAWVLSIVGTAILIPLWLVAMMANATSDIFIGVNNMVLDGALRASLDFIIRRWRTLLVFSLMLFGLSILALLLTVVPAGLISLIFVFLGRLAYHNGSAGLLDLRIISVLTSFLTFFLVYALMVVFHQVAWILAVNELTKLPKVEEEQLVELPEVAS